mgnify:CR=1 FL=1
MGVKLILIKQKRGTLACSQCGSKLIIINKTETKDNFSKITITSYRCSNKSCQDTIDKRTTARIKLQDQQNMARANRLKSNIKLGRKRN